MILIIDCGSSKVPYIEEAVDLSCDYQTIGLNDLSKVKLENFKGIIISGAPILITEIELQPYLNLFSWIKTYENPILGICFGHQMISLIYGGFGSRQKEDRDLQTISIYEYSPLFERLAEEIQMIEDHCECVSIPQDFKLLAGSDACVNEAMQHKNKLIFGVQFHPEVSGTIGTQLIENFITICFNKEQYVN